MSKVLLGATVSPGRTLRRSVEAPGRIQRAALAVAAVGGLYALTSLGLGVSGAVPLWPVLRGLDTDNYYFWQMILILPGIFLSWVIVAGLLYAPLPRKARDDGFGASLALAGPALGGPLLAAWLPPAVQAVLMTLGMGQEEWVGILSEPGLWQTLYLACYILAGLFALRLFVISSGLLRKRAGPAALVHGLIVAAAAIAAFLALVR